MRITGALAGISMALMIRVAFPDGSSLATGRMSAVRVDNGVVINSRAGYFFNLPKDWRLDDSSDYRSLKVVDPASGSNFSVDYDRARGDASMYSFALAMTFGSPASGWVSEGTQRVTLGGRPASEVRGTRTAKDGKISRERFWVIVDGEFAYTLSSSVPEDQADSTGVAVEQIISSFNWGRPKKPK